MQALESSILLDPAVVPEYAAPFISQGVPFKETAFYLHVGEKVREQGWMLHLSVMVGRYFDLMSSVLPVLLDLRVAFKVVRSSPIHEEFNKGDYGEVNIGKVVTIFIEDEEGIEELVSQLNMVTSGFVGPKVQTDFRIGKVLYCRYGSFLPDNGKDGYGNIFPQFMDNTGKWVIDDYSIPAKLPQGVPNPFQYFMEAWPNVPFAKAIRGRYTVEKKIREEIGVKWYEASQVNAEGNLSYLWVKCVHEGEAEALLQQYKLGLELNEQIPMPKVVDFGEVEEFAYLVFHKLAGRRLDEVIRESLGEGTWYEMKKLKKNKVYCYGLSILNLLQKIYALGYELDDFDFRNFFVDVHDQVYLFDIKTLHSRQIGGTFNPLNAWGKVALQMTTGFSVYRLLEENPAHLMNKLQFITGESGFADLLAKSLYCKQYDTCVTEEIKNNLGKFTNLCRRYFSREEIGNIIQKGINGLGGSLALSDNLWFTRVDKTYDPETYALINKYTATGVNRGVGGVLYVLCKLKDHGYDISSLTLPIEAAWEYIGTEAWEKIDEYPQSFYNGASGIAVLVKNAIQSGLLSNDPRYLGIMEKSLMKKDNTKIHLSNGVSGDGVAMLQLHRYFPKIEDFLSRIKNYLVQSQKKDGTWENKTNIGSREDNIMGFGPGLAGIIYFLLEIGQRQQWLDATYTANHGLDYLMKTANFNKDSITWPISDKDPKRKSGFYKGTPGIGFAFLKSFEYCGNLEHLNIGEAALRCNSHKKVSPYLSQMDGLSGLGELYLDAYRITGHEEWMERAKWIAQWICALRFTEKEDSVYWLAHKSKFPTADIMTGNAGLLHFLLRYLYPETVFMPLLPEPLSTQFNPCIKLKSHEA